jgi:hypothetical protein
LCDRGAVESRRLISDSDRLPNPTGGRGNREREHNYINKGKEYHSRLARVDYCVALLYYIFVSVDAVAVLVVAAFPWQLAGATPMRPAAESYKMS